MDALEKKLSEALEELRARRSELQKAAEAKGKEGSKQDKGKESGKEDKGKRGGKDIK